MTAAPANIVEAMTSSDWWGPWFRRGDWSRWQVFMRALFGLPILLFMLTLLRVVSPSFLLNHSRYAILGIVIVAAIVTPTPDVFNLMLFAVPMCMLFFLGIFLSYILVLKREHRSFPWKPFLSSTALTPLPLIVRAMTTVGRPEVAIASAYAAST